MLPSSPLQDSLFQRQPDLHWLLDEQGNLIEPLLHQWALQLRKRHHYTRPLADCTDVLLWAIEKNATAPALQATFNWLHKTLQLVRGATQNEDRFLHDLKKTHPDLLQTLMQNVPWVNSVWDTSFALKYAPDPDKLWNNQPEWTVFYAASNALTWTKREGTHANSSAWAIPNDTVVKAMHSVMGEKPFLLWQYGVYFSTLSQNSHNSSGAPGGRKYGFAAALTLLEPAIELGLAPNAISLAQDTVRRYKGQDLVQDMLKGLEYCMEVYEDKGFDKGLDYCASMLNTLVPFALKEGLATGNQALGLDKKITNAVQAGRMDESLAQSWFEERLRSGRGKLVDFKTFSPQWPPTLRATLVNLETTIQRQLNPKWSAGGAMLAMCDLWSFEPTATKTLLDNASPAQWKDFQHILDKNDKTGSVVSLLQTPHPWIDEYKSSPRARVAVVAACMVFINDQGYVQNLRYRNLAGLFETGHETPIGKLSLPQPLGYFADCFPQYRTTWQRLACEMAAQNPMGASTKPDKDADNLSVAARRVVDALASLMLGKPVDAQSLLRVRESLDPNMDYETLVQSQFNSAEVFELPATFDENMFSSDEQRPG